MKKWEANIRRVVVVYSGRKPCQPDMIKLIQMKIHIRLRRE